MKILLRGGSFWAFLFLAIASPRLVDAVVIRVSDTANATAPTDDPGFSHVAAVNGASGVYLGTFSGQNWVLTADHVGGASGGPSTTISQVTLGGINYNVLRGIRLTDPSSPTTGTDLDLLQINYTGPSLSNLSISSTVPGLASQVVMIGNGYNRAAADNYWASDWTDLGTNSSGSAHQGYKFSNAYTQTIRWGTNNISQNAAMNGVDDTINYGYGPVIAFHTIFNKLAGGGADANNEAQVVRGDSGGAVFYKNGSSWELSGAIVTMGILSGQPQDPTLGAYYPVFGDSSYAVDLSQYRQQILAAMGLSTWSGGGGNNNWSTSGNWDSAPVNGNSLAFAGTTRLSNSNDSLSSVGSITFNSGAGAFTLSGNALTVSGGITNNSTALQTVNLNVTLNAIQQFSAASGNLTLGGAIANAGNVLTLNSSANKTMTLAGSLSGTAGVIKSGTGTVALSASNSYAGGTTVNNGVLSIAHFQALGSGGLTINNDGYAQVGDGVGTVVIPTLSVNGGSATPTATLDVGTNAVVIPYSGASPFATIRNQVLYATHDLAFDRPGITSSGADGASSALGYAEASELFVNNGGTFVNNQSPRQSGANTVIANQAVILKYTWIGDTDLNGAVNLSDFYSLFSNFGITVGADWNMGDTNGNGTVDLADVSNLFANFGASGLAGDGSSGPVPVPEPSALVLAAMGLTGVAAAAVRRGRRVSRRDAGGLN